MRTSLAAARRLLFLLAPATLGAQSTATGPLLRARHLSDTASVKVMNAAGSVRFVGWRHDSIEVRGHIAAGERFYFLGGDVGMKLGLEERADAAPSRPCDLVIFLPLRSRVSVKTVSADITGRDVSGWFYTVSGDVQLSGSASSLDVLSMNGTVDVDANTPFVRARAGDGRLTLRGSPEDADVSTVSGRLDVATSAIRRGQFESVTGDIHYSGTPAAGAILDFSSHSGPVELAIPSTASAQVSMTSVAGSIANAFPGVVPASSSPRSLVVRLGGGSAHVTVRTYKGAIRLRPR